MLYCIVLFINGPLYAQKDFLGQYVHEDEFLSLYIELMEDSTFEVTHISESSKDPHVGLGKWQFDGDSIVMTFKNEVSCTDIIDSIIYSNSRVIKDSITVKILDEYDRPVEYFRVFPCTKCSEGMRWNNDFEIDVKEFGCKFGYTNEKGEFRFKPLRDKSINIASASYFGGVNCCLPTSSSVKDITVKLKVNAELYYLFSIVKVYRSEPLKFKVEGDFLRSQDMVLTKTIR